MDIFPPEDQELFCRILHSTYIIMIQLIVFKNQFIVTMQRRNKIIYYGVPLFRQNRPFHLLLAVR